MAEPILSREVIAAQAEFAARAATATGAVPQNPYPVGSDAAAAWQASFDRYQHALQAPESEQSA